MSKIFNVFEKKKLENPNKLYLFKSGIFYGKPYNRGNEIIDFDHDLYWT